MPRPLFVAAAAAALVLTSCGDDNKGAPAPPPATPLSGTVLGRPFTSADATALVLPPSSCDLYGLGVPVSTTGLVIGFGSFQGLCSVATQTKFCDGGGKANATIVTVEILRINVADKTATPVRPGTYTIFATPHPAGDLEHEQVVDAYAERTDATCGGQPLPAASGTVRIDAVGASVTGAVDLTFPDGGKLTGPFSAPACGFRTDVCTVLEGRDCTGAPVCVP
jgi:hypothetical protein